MRERIKRNIFAILLSAIGTAFLIYYIYRASVDVIASDYIRIVHYYLEDVFDFSLLFSWEGISRIPFTFLARIINKEYFNYSVFFDKILGVFGLFLFNLMTIKFILNTLKSTAIKIIASIIITFISFSLVSWEMILNGTGYPHLITTGLIALTFYLFDRIVKRTKTIMTLENLDSSDLKFYGNERENNRLSNMVSLIDTSQMQRNNLRAHFFVYLLTIGTSVLFAGSYAVGFLSAIIFFSIVEIIVFIVIRNKYNKGEIDSFDADRELYAEFREQYNGQEIRGFGKYKGEKYSTVNNETTFKIFFKFLILIIFAIICMSCYFKSSNTGEALVPVGFKDVTLLEILKENPSFPIQFLLKSLASAIIGVETFSYAIDFKTISEGMIFFIGYVYIIIFIITFIFMIIRAFTKNSKNTNIFDINSYRNIFPLMYIVLGLFNFALVFLARYKFLKDDYGMSSRYGIQYMFLTIGILLIQFIFLDDIVYNKKYYKKDTRELKLSKAYLKRRERLIELGRIKREPPKVSVIHMVMITISIFCVSVLLFGHITTTTDEIFKADYRKMIYERLEGMAKEYEIYNDKELEDAFEYKRNVNHIKHALKILKEQKLNVFREK